jgi:hypothetical protein
VLLLLFGGALVSGLLKPLQIADVVAAFFICPLNLLSVLFMERRSCLWDDRRQRRSRGHGTPGRSWRRAV